MKSNLIKTSFGVTFILCVGYAVSFIKESVLANFFGAGAAIDAYTIALQIPVILFAFVAVALRSIVIPVYTDIKHNVGVEESKVYINALISTLSIFALALIGLIFIFAKYVILVFAPGFSPETNFLAAQLLRIMCPTILCTIVSNICISVLNVHGKFIWPSIAVLFLNTTVILSILFLHSHYGIFAAAVGQLIGCCIELAYLLVLFNKHVQFRFMFDLRNAHVRKSLKMSVPVIWSTSLAEVTAMINKIVASFLFVGSIAVLSYASKINSMFISLFTSAIATIIYPLYADSTAKNDMTGLNIRINKTLAAYVLFLMPLTALILCLKKEIIEIAFARGAFDAEAVERTQILLGWYSIGLIFMGFRESLTKVFYSLKDTKTPAINASIGFILNIVLNVSLPFVLGVQGLAISTSVTAIVISMGLLFRLLRRYSEIKVNLLKSNTWKILPCTLIAALFTIVVKHFSSDLNTWIYTFICCIAFGVVYILSLLCIRPGIWVELIKGLRK
ncbi:MAG: murein biosynthesis integral membrane protein MurJ [Bacteroidales bacterium]|nr:murein biosynthesis integral membrane protein MurJ [Bacteroidales bacterium]